MDVGIYKQVRIRGEAGISRHLVLINERNRRRERAHSGLISGRLNCCVIPVNRDYPPRLSNYRTRWQVVSSGDTRVPRARPLGIATSFLPATAPLRTDNETSRETGGEREKPSRERASSYYRTGYRAAVRGSAISYTKPG